MPWGAGQYGPIVLVLLISHGAFLFDTPMLLSDYREAYSEELYVRQSIKIINAALIISAAASAGPITLQQYQIGGANGLTANYLANPNSNSCATPGDCVTSTTPLSGSSGAWQYRSYENSMFETSTITNQSQTLPNLTGSTTTAATISDSNIKDSNGNSVTFSLLNGGGTTNALDNIWSSTGAGVDALNIPIGLADVSQVWTMLNDYYGFAGQTLSIQFNFSATATGSIISSPTVNLTEGTVYKNGTSTSGNLRSALNCTGTIGSGTTCPATTTGASPDNGLTVPSGSAILSGGCQTPTTLFGSGSTAIGVCDSTVWSGNYAISSGSGTGTPFNASSGNSSSPGNAMLDDQDFSFGTAYAADWLQSITITTTSGNLQNDSRIGLSAITVQAPIQATPEPASLSMLFLGGLGLFGMARFRRRSC